MNILITGGAGFIGSHLAELCLREGWSVSVLDDLSTGSVENIAHLLDDQLSPVEVALGRRHFY